MTILIIKTGDALPEVKSQRGDFEDWFVSGLGLGATGLSHQVVDVTRGQVLPDGGYSGVVVTGSPAMVTEQLAWSEATAGWLRQQPSSMPMLGVCYGHQLLAHAFGGVVADNPNGRQIGTIDVTFSNHQSDPLLGHLPVQISAQASHVQSVIEPPEGARVLASSPRDAHHAIRFRDRAWGLQFHPEWDADITRRYLEQRRQPISAEGQDVDHLIARTTEADHAGPILQAFTDLLVNSAAEIN